MNEDFVRQRRNLFAASIAILLFEYGSVTVESVSLPSASIKIGNITAIYLAIWVGFFYFLLRYMQHLLEYEWATAIGNFVRELDVYCVKEISSQLPEGRYIGTVEEHASVGKLVFSSPLVLQLPVRNSIAEIPMPEWHVIRGRKLIVPIMRGMLAWIVRSPYFTDIVLPILLAAYVLGHCTFSAWPGAVHTIVAG